MVNKILWRAPPYSAPGHRAPPKLSQIQMKAGDLMAQITANILPALRTQSRLDVTEAVSAFMVQNVLGQPDSVPYTKILLSASPVEDTPNH